MQKHTLRLLPALLTLIIAAPTYVEARTIEFGRPGPPQSIAFQDGVAAASVTFRVSPDARYNAGPAAVPPSISSGSLIVRAFGVTRRYDLSAIFPISTDRINLSKESSCGTATALSRSGAYLIVEAVLAERGCAALAVFIGLHDGRVAQEAIFDPAWAHRFDARPYRASGMAIRVVQVERVVAEASRWNSASVPPTIVAWPFSIVHATNGRGGTLAFALDLAGEPPIPGRAARLQVGDSAFLDSTVAGDPLLFGPLFSDERFVRPDGAAESRFDALQTSTPADVQARVRRNI